MTPLSTIAQRQFRARAVQLGVAVFAPLRGARVVREEPAQATFLDGGTRKMELVAWP